MGWFNRNNKEKVTREQLAAALYYFAKKVSVHDVLHEMSKENSPFKNADKDVFMHESLIMSFWIIDKFFADKERKLTAAVHKKYFTDLDILNNQEEAKEEISFIMNRYKEYYDAYNAKAGLEQYFLWGAIARNILQQDKPVMNFLINSLVGIDVMLLIKELKESIFDHYEIID
jgi:hypothetical protein